MSNINVKKSTVSGLYEDGQPVGYKTFGYDKGDGTVLLNQSLPLDGWVNVMTDNDAGHFALIKSYASDIAQFLDPTSQQSYYNLRVLDAVTQGTPTGILGVTIQGWAAPLVTDPNGKRSGIVTPAR